jgi:hypothetical protein
MIARAKLKDRGQQDAAEIADRTEGKPRQTVGVDATVEARPVYTWTKEECVARIHKNQRTYATN